MRLPGYVDVDVYSTNSLESLREEPLRIAATVCKLKPAPEQYIMQYEALKMSQRDGVFIGVEQLIYTLQAMVQSAQSFNDAADLAQLQDFMTGLDQAESAVRSDLEVKQSTLEEDPAWKSRLETSFSEVQGNLNDVRRRLATQIRVKKLSEK